MRTFLYVAYVFSFALIVRARAFDDEHIIVKEYVLGQLLCSVKDCEIAVIQDRCDEWARDDDSAMKWWQMNLLNLKKVRCVKKMKGHIAITNNIEWVYIYQPLNEEWLFQREVSSSRQHRVFPPYFPLIMSDDQMKLVLMKPQKSPLREHIEKEPHDDRAKRFVEDEREMVASEFLAKYNLSTFFLYNTYLVKEGCVFEIEYSAPALEETKGTRLNKDVIAGIRKRISDKQKFADLIHLTPREVSEIVYISYLLGGKDGAARYADVAKDSPLLEPVETGKFKTNLGRRLAEATGVSKADGDVD